MPLIKILMQRQTITFRSRLLLRSIAYPLNFRQEKGEKQESSNRASSLLRVHRYAERAHPHSAPTKHSPLRHWTVERRPA